MDPIKSELEAQISERDWEWKLRSCYLGLRLVGVCWVDPLVRPLKTASPGIHVVGVMCCDMRAESGIGMCLGCGLVWIWLWTDGVVIVMVDCGFGG